MWRTLAAILTGFAVVQGWRKARNEAGAALAQRQRSAPAPPSQKISHFAHPGEAEHRTAEQFFWRASRRLELATLLVATIGLAVAFVGAVYARRQLNIALEQQRAWVYPSFVFGDAVAIDGGNYVFPIRANYVNSGHSPAFLVAMYADLELLSSTKDAPIDASSVSCQKARDGAIEYRLIASTVFPDQAGQGSINLLSMSKAAWMKAGGADIVRIIVVRGCVDYRLAGDPTHHQTPFALILGQPPLDGVHPRVLTQDDLTGVQFTATRLSVHNSLGAD